MSEISKNLWAVVVDNYESPSRFSVTVIETQDLVAENVAAFMAMKTLPASTLLGVFAEEAAARSTASLVLDVRDGRADIQELLTRPPGDA